MSSKPPEGSASWKAGPVGVGGGGRSAPGRRAAGPLFAPRGGRDLLPRSLTHIPPASGFGQLDGSAAQQPATDFTYYTGHT